MESTEKLGLGLAGLVMGGMLIALIATSPDPGPNAPPSSLAAASPGAAIQTISSGEQVDVQAHLQPGTRTIVEFTAEW